MADTVRPESPMDEETSELSKRLDQDHLPETNGRMAICRRCGFRTTSESGDRHVLLEGQAARATAWLGGQATANRLTKAREALDT
jgi:hypothetical protein